MWKCNVCGLIYHSKIEAACCHPDIVKVTEKELKELARTPATHNHPILRNCTCLQCSARRELGVPENA